MGKYTTKAKELVKKIDYAPGYEAASKILDEFQSLIGKARMSKEGRDELPIIHELQKDAKNKVAGLKK